MATSRRIAGTQTLTVNGTSIELVEPITYKSTILDRKELLSIDGSFNWSEEPVIGTIEATLRDNGTFSVADLFAMCPATVEGQLANGKQVVMVNGIAMGDWDVDTKEATIKAKWMSRAVTEQLAN